MTIMRITFAATPRMPRLVSRKAETFWSSVQINRTLKQQNAKLICKININAPFLREKKSYIVLHYEDAKLIINRVF